jgi:hypothetical protein
MRVVYFTLLRYAKAAQFNQRETRRTSLWNSQTPLNRTARIFSWNSNVHKKCFTKLGRILKTIERKTLHESFLNNILKIQQCFYWLYMTLWQNSCTCADYTYQYDRTAVLVLITRVNVTEQLCFCCTYILIWNTNCTCSVVTVTYQFYWYYTYLALWQNSSNCTGVLVYSFASRSCARAH